MALRLGEEIGSGAVGKVVEVLDDDDDAVYAGKILHESHGSDSTARARFANEASLLEGLRHDNLVRVFGIEDVEAREVLLMERIVGDSLATIIARSAPLPEARIASLGHGIASGLAAAHHAGLIHRDLKPANVLVTGDDVPKIVDFGMARASSFTGIGEHALAVIGTPAYMAPETIDPLAVDSRSDLYALGCILFEMASGRLPFSGATSFAVLEAHRNAEIPHPPREISEPLARVIRGLLAKSPADRPQSATTVADDLDAIVHDRSTALARYGETPGGRCASCGDALVVGVDVCFACRERQPMLSPGRKTVFVTGPGDVATKLDVKLRQALLDWLRGNPSLGLDPQRLAKKVPRLPFALAIGVSEITADGLVRALDSLGLQTEVTDGGRYSHPGVRSKAWKLAGRVALIAISSTVYVANSWGAVFLPVAGVMGVGSIAAGWIMAGRQPIDQRPARQALPPAISKSLDRVAGVLPEVSASRHRQNLRAAVQRVLSLRGFFAARGLSDFDEELARVIDLAVVASARIDELEQGLDQASMRTADEELRARLRERDMWAARLMETIASMESVRARYVAGELELEDRGAESVLSDLRMQVEALREVEQL